MKKNRPVKPEPTASVVLRNVVYSLTLLWTLVTVSFITYIKIQYPDLDNPISGSVFIQMETAPRVFEIEPEWKTFCSSLGRYARVRAELRDQGVDQSRSSTQNSIRNKRVLAVMRQATEFAYEEEELSPEMVAAEIIVTCLETKENQ